MSARTYRGGCQCGAVRYETSADLDNIIACNCSRCGKMGLMLSFTGAGDFNLESGEDSLSEYQFNRHVIHHLFCKVCGVQSFSRGNGPDGKPMVAINVRCLDGVNVHDLHPKPYDGRGA